MSHRCASVSISLGLLALLAATPVSAADLPQIKATAQNPIPACATPGRLMAFLKARNPRLDAGFDGIATEYMRHGEELGIRWDIAFFQMLVETGNLTFKGDVKPHQNNFAGLGATGNGERGESFKNVSTGARAHLEHVLMYSGVQVPNATAERTRKVQEWGVLTSWQKSIKGPMTFTHLTRKWSPYDRGYSDDIQSVASSFTDGACLKPDPQPELVALARGGKVIAAKSDTSEKPSGREIAVRNIEAERATSNGERSSLGAASIATTAKPAAPAVNLLNATPSEASVQPVAAPSAAVASAAKDTKLSKGKEPAKTAAISPPPAAAAAAASPSSKCRVWQASYGGAKAVIIRAGAGSETNYTVLDVNEGAEKREAEAYIAAYAKGGQSVGEFQNTAQALDKAFELCPEG